MAQTGYTPIQLYRTTTLGAAPSAVNLADGELAINVNDSDMALYAKNNTGNVKRLINNPAGLKYPTADGSSGQVVTTDGAGNLTLTSPTVGSYPSAGISVSTGSAWGTSLVAPSGSIVGTTDTQTLTNKTVVLRVVAVSDATSVTINADTTDMATQANTQVAGTLTINAPTGTPVNGQKIIFRLLSTNAQTFSWNAIFAGSTDLSLPTASSGSSKYDYMGFIYNSTSSKWQIIAKNFGF